jgi:hypothetical protein
MKQHTKHKSPSLKDSYSQLRQLKPFELEVPKSGLQQLK